MSASRLDPAFLARPITHRGLHDKARGVIENSLSAVQAAIDAGYGIEIDVQISRDDDALVFHDYDLVRLVGRQGYVRELSTESLLALTLTGGHDRIPTLHEVLDRVAGQVPLLVEIKDQDMRLGPAESAIERAVVNLLTGYDGPLAVMSFNPHVMERVIALAPDLAAGLVTDPFDGEDWPIVPEARRTELADIPDAERLGLDFISHNRADLGSAAVARLKAAGLPILCWTVRSDEEARVAYDVADQITFEGFLPAP